MKGREDDNIDTIRKRFKVFLESSLPVIEYYNSKGKVRKVNKYTGPSVSLSFIHCSLIRKRSMFDFGVSDVLFLNN